MLRLYKRTSDSRGLHPSASPHHPPIRPPPLPPPPPPLWQFVRRRSKGGETAEEETEGTLRQHVPQQTQTNQGTLIWRQVACNEDDGEEKEPRFYFFLGGLDMSGVCNIWCPWTHMFNEDLFLSDFTLQFRWWCRFVVPALRSAECVWRQSERIVSSSVAYGISSRDVCNISLFVSG